MPPAAKAGESIAGGVILGPGAQTVMVEGLPLSLVEDHAAPHGIAPHDDAMIISGSTSVLAEGKPAVRIGDLASCGHIVSTGAATVEIG